MAYARKVKNGWRIEVERNGVRKSGTFATKSAATQWALVAEAAILADKGRQFPRKTLADAIARYKPEISVKKRGHRAEGLRFDAITKDFPKLVAMQLVDIKTDHIAEWRDTRLQLVTSGSVLRDISLLRNLFTVARDEWRWIGESPFTGLRLPAHNPARTRRVAPSEVKRICRHLDYKTGVKPVRKQQEVALAFLIALRTGMRAGEVLSLTPENVDRQKRVATVAHKTQHLTGKPRAVPLSRKALRLIPEGWRFTLTGPSLDALFRKATAALLIDDLHFHDSRREALTRMATKLSVMDLAKVSGHKDLRILLAVYYAPTAASIADMLDG